VAHGLGVYGREVTTNLTRTQARQRSAALELHTGEVELDLSESTDPARTTYPTRTTLTLTAREPGTFLDFIGDSVQSLEVNGQEREIEYDGARLTLRGLVTDQTNTVTVRATARYSRSGEGLHRYVDPVDGQTYLYTHFEPADARRVFANCEQPDLKARYTVIVTAPAHWQIRGNQPEVQRADAGTNAAGQALARVRFAQTPPLSTYLVCVAAGPYRCWEDTWSGPLPQVGYAVPGAGAVAVPGAGAVAVPGAGADPGTGTLTVPIAALCRASLADSFDPENVLRLTKAGLDHFHRDLGFAYPWGKYDSIFVPEYNIGAMENPGLVTFNDATYVFQSGATRADHERRATTIMHEMSHMWFGDLVTPAWWDDLWLKESLADYLGTAVTAQATEYRDAWTAFCARRKAWAYRADQLPTTHPIVADIPDVEAAKQNFDGITYAKGAAVLKQLVAYVGQDHFAAGMRRYFDRHAYGCATLTDLLGELEAASGRALTAWSQLWLHTAGVATLTPLIDYADDGTIARLEVLQDGRDARTGAELLRPHRITLGLYGAATDDPADGAGLVRFAAYRLDVTGARTEVPQAVGAPAPQLVVVDDEDLTFAKRRLDEAGLRTALRRLAELDSSLTRAVLWGSLWNECRDGRLSAGRYVPFVLEAAAREPDGALVAMALENAVQAATEYTPAGGDRDAMLTLIVQTSWDLMTDPARGPDQQLVWARALGAAALSCPARSAEVSRLLAGATVPGLAMGAALRWLFLRGLAATGQIGPDELDAELARDQTSSAPVRHRAALASLPTAAAKRAAWDALLGDATLTNHELSASAEGFATPGQGALRVPYVEAYFTALPRVWASRSQELAQRVVTGAFPSGIPPESGLDVPTLATGWLAAHPDAPGALRRKIVELTDDAQRAARARAAYTL